MIITTNSEINILKPRNALNKAFLKVKPNRSDIERFKTNLIQLLDRINDAESEEFHKNLVIDFLKKTYYDPDHFINTKGKNDLVIHNGNKATTTVGVIIEAKKPTNKAEMISREKINVKAFHELILYYLRERITLKNLEIKYLAATNINEWFIFDANIFEKYFAQNKELVHRFTEFENNRLSGNTTDFFYNEIAAPFVAELKQTIEFTYFDIRDYEKPLRNNNPKDDNQLIALYKLLSPEHLLKLPFANDSNTLDKRFYGELLHIIGLTETKQGSKKLIERNKPGARNSGSLLENAIIQIDSLDKLSQLRNPNHFGETKDERLFNVALELSITWINRILFLKLLEAQLKTYHKGDKSYEFLNLEKISDYDELNKLFFRVLACKQSERTTDLQKSFSKVPFLNSSLFEPTGIEHATLLISNLDHNIKLPLYSATVLKDKQGRKRSGELTTLEYIFEFLNAYDFSSEGSEDIQEDNKTLINASVLGLIFEKINGYKDGSFFTPGFITMYMCRETIRRAVVQKFNETKKWNCKDLDEVYNKIEDRNEANKIINELKICDPAVGSGHFLVSALNEIIAIKNDLKILQDRNGKRLKEYHVEVVNDELIITDEDGGFFEYIPTNKEKQRIQETLFHEKQTIIENCLFGVDINPNSVKICRLRLWIELLKNSYYKNETELETLPNIDINIKCGNSLISRFDIDADLSQALKKSKWNVDMYRMAVATYRNAENKEQKREMEKLISDIKSDFRMGISQNDPKVRKLQKLEYEYGLLVAPNIFKEDEALYGNKDVQKKDKERAEKLLAEINKLKNEIEEIKNNKIFENAFEWRFEFPEVLDNNGDFIGFDVVIGNPPYIRQEELKTTKDYLKENFKLFSSTADILVYFFELSFKILKPDAYFCMITSNKFMKANYGKALRKYLLEYQLIEIIDFGELPVFEEAATFPAIFLIKNKDRNNVIHFTQVNSLKFTSLKEKVIEIGEKLPDEAFGEDYWSLGNSKVNSIHNKMKENSITLAEYTNKSIYRGILTGYNIAFIIDEQKRGELIKKDPKSFEIIHPYAIGDDIRFYEIRNKKRYIILTKIGIEIEKYPAIFEHLKQYQEALEKRWDKGNHWWELRACAYYDIFEKPKIIFPDIAKESRWAYTKETLFIGNTAYVIPITDFALLGLMNSKAVFFYYSQIASVLGDAKKGGRLRWIYQDVSKIPIPSLEKQRKTIELLVTKIISMKKENPKADTSALEAEIDQLVYELYGLTEEEIAIIENSTN